MASLGDVISLGESVCTIYNALQERMRQRQENPQLTVDLRDRFQYLCDTLVRLDHQCKSGEMKISHNLVELYEIRLHPLKVYLQTTQAELDALQKNLDRKFRLFRRVRDVNEWLKEQHGKIADMDAHLQKITDCFTMSDGMAGITDAINSATQSKKDTFKPSFLVPPNPPHVILKFGPGASSGKEVPNQLSPEERLRQSLLRLHEFHDVAAVGAPIGPIVGMKGMGGIGKSCALRGLASLDDVRTRFCDGIYWLVLGHDATERRVVEQLARITRESGGETQAKAVREESELDSAVSRVTDWFRGKTILLLIDDVWKDALVGSNAMSRLKEIVDVGKGSRVAFTAREWGLVSGSEEIEFSTKGDVSSLEILLKSAGIKREEVESLRGETERLLRFCGGLPLALSVVGRAIAAHREIASELSLENVLDEYLEGLQDSSSLILDERADESYVYENLSIAFGASLSMMDRKKTTEDAQMMSHAEMYESLVVIQRQGWLPLGVLRLLWGQKSEVQARRVLHKFVKASLAARMVGMLNGRMTEGVTLHDLQLDYVQKRFGNGGERGWHAKLVEAWGWEESESTAERPWFCGKMWKSNVVKDEYFRNSLCRHLRKAGLMKDLQIVLGHPSWTAERLCHGEGFGLQEDFRFFTDRTGGRGQRCDLGDTVWSLQKISTMARLSAPLVLQSSREVWFHLYDRLLRFRNESKEIQEYLSRVDEMAEKPWLKSLTPRSNASNAVQDILQCEGDVIGVSSCTENDEVIAWGESETHLFRSTFRNGEMKKNRLLKEPGVGTGFFARLWSHNGMYVVTKTFGNGWQVWNMHGASTAQRVGPELNLADDFTSCMDLTGDGKRLAHGGRGGKVVLWDVEQGTKIKEVTGEHNDHFLKVSFSPNGKQVAFFGARGSTLMLHGETGEMITEDMGAPRYPTCVSWSKNGKRLAVDSQSGKVLIINGETGERTKDDLIPTGEKDGCLSWSTDGKLLFSGGNHGLSVLDGGSGEEIVNFLIYFTFFAKISVSGNGRWLAAAHHDLSKVVSLWDVETGAKVWASAEQHSDDVSVVGWLEDGTRMFSADAGGKLVIWGWDDLERVHEERNIESEKVRAVAWSTDDMCISTVGEDGDVFMHDFNTGKLMWKDVEAHASPVDCLKVSEDNRRAFSLARDGKTVTWDTKTGERLWQSKETYVQSPNSYTGACWFQDATMVLAWEGKSIVVWDGKTGERVWKKVSTRNIRCVAWSKNDAKVACGDDSGKIILRDSKDGALLRYSDAGHTSPIKLVKWCPNDEWIASSSWGSDERVSIWNLETGDRMWCDKEERLPVPSLEWSEDGRFLAYGTHDGKLVIWNVKTGDYIEAVQGSGDVNQVAWSQDGSRVATMSGDRTLQISNVTSQDMFCVKRYENIASFGRRDLREIGNTDEENWTEELKRKLKIRVKGDGLFCVEGREETRLATIYRGDRGEWYCSTSCRHIAIREQAGGLYFFEIVET